MKLIQPVDINIIDRYSGRNSCLLFASRLMSLMGSSIFGFVLSLYILDTTGSAAAFSVVLIASMVPSALVNCLGGVWVDRNDKRKIIIFSDLLTGVAIFVFLALFHIQWRSTELLIIYTVVVNLIQGFFNTAFRAAVPNLIKTESVVKFNSVVEALVSICNITGPLLGVILYGLVGIEAVMLINGTTFIVSAVINVCIVFKPFTKSRNRDGETYLDGLKSIFHHIGRNRIMKFFIFFAIAANFIYLPLMLLGVPFVSYSILKVTKLQLSIIEGSAAVGTILGALIIATGRNGNWFVKKFFPLLMGQGFIFLFWAVPALSIFDGINRWGITLAFSASLVLLGILSVMELIPMITYFQVRMTDELRGRLMGFLYTVLIASMPLGMAVYGFLLDRVNWVYITVASGICMISMCVAGHRNKHFKEFIRQVETEEEAEQSAAVAIEGECS